MPNSSENKRVLVLALSGIGNFLMQTPVFRALKEAHPSWHITVWVAPRGTKILAENNPFIDAVIEAPIKNTLGKHWQLAQQLAEQKFDSGIMLSPGQLIKGAAYMWLAGIPVRIGHTYPFMNTLSSNFLLTKSLAEEKNVHDVDQNLRLLTLVDIAVPNNATSYDFSIPEAATEEADTLLREHGVPQDRPLIGMHMGSAPGFEFKRWPLERFAVVAHELIKKHNAHVLIFGGPDETELKQGLKTLVGEHSTVITTGLLTAAACIKKCRLFISNDSGLMHLAAACGVPVFALFGPTNEKETGPLGVATHVLRANGTQSSYTTEISSVPTSNASLVALSTDTVLRAVLQSWQ